MTNTPINKKEKTENDVIKVIFLFLKKKILFFQVLEDGWNKFSIFAKSAAEKIKQGSSELTQKVSEKNWSQDVSQFSTKIVESSEKGW